MLPQALLPRALGLLAADSSFVIAAHCRFLFTLLAEQRVLVVEFGAGGGGALFLPCCLGLAGLRGRTGRLAELGRCVAVCWRGEGWMLRLIPVLLGYGCIALLLLLLLLFLEETYFTFALNLLLTRALFPYSLLLYFLLAQSFGVLQLPLLLGRIAAPVE